jgi:hypothetical protein
MVHAPPIGSNGSLVLAWRSGVDLECFQINANTISTRCYSDPRTTLGCSHVFMALLMLLTNYNSGII